MELDQIMPFVILITVVIILAQIGKHLDPKKGPGANGKPCHENGKPHTWQHVQVPNQYGEQVWIHFCTTCKRRPGQL